MRKRKEITITLQIEDDENEEEIIQEIKRQRFDVERYRLNTIQNALRDEYRLLDTEFKHHLITIQPEMDWANFETWEWNKLRALDKNGGSALFKNWEWQTNTTFKKKTLEESLLTFDQTYSKDTIVHISHYYVNNADSNVHINLEITLPYRVISIVKSDTNVEYPYDYQYQHTDTVIHRRVKLVRIDPIMMPVDYLDIPRGEKFDKLLEILNENGRYAVLTKFFRCLKDARRSKIFTMPLEFTLTTDKYSEKSTRHLAETFFIVEHKCCPNFSMKIFTPSEKDFIHLGEFCQYLTILFQAQLTNLCKLIFDYSDFHEPEYHFNFDTS